MHFSTLWSNDWCVYMHKSMSLPILAQAFRMRSFMFSGAVDISLSVRTMYSSRTFLHLLFIFLWGIRKQNKNVGSHFKNLNWPSNDHQNVLQIKHNKRHLLSPIISNNFYPRHFFLQCLFYFFFRYFTSSTYRPQLRSRDNIIVFHLVGPGWIPGWVSFPDWIFPVVFLNFKTNVGKP